MKLREYQLDIVDELTRGFAAHRAICLQLATGGGKTAISGEIARRLIRNKGDAVGGYGLFLVHRRELVRQAVNTFKAFGLERHVGVIQAGVPETPWAGLQVASVQTLRRRVKRLHWLKPHIIFIDEAHHCRAATWEYIIGHYPRSRLLGLTATPARTDGKGLGTMFDKLVCGPSHLELVRLGFLAETQTFWVPAGLDLQGVGKVAGDYNQGQMDKRVTDVVIANGFKNFVKYASDRQTLHYAVTRRHSKAFVETAKSNGYAAEHVDGDTPSHIRDDIFKRFEEKKIQILSNVGIATEGYDCPSCSCAIIGRPTKSIVLWRQMVGRPMRPKPDGLSAMILDLAGNDDCGDPDSEIEWTLEDGVNEDKAKRERRNTRTCAKCGFSFPVAKTVCPVCNAVHLTKTAEEVDVELEGRRANTKPAPYGGQSRKVVNAKVFGIIRRGGDIEELKDLARSYGYSEGKAYIWQKQFGAILEQTRR